MATSLDEYLQQQLGERPAKPPPRRRRKLDASKAATDLERYLSYELEFDAWASRNMDRATEFEAKRPGTVARFAQQIKVMYLSWKSKRR